MFKITWTKINGKYKLRFEIFRENMDTIEVKIMNVKE